MSMLPRQMGLYTQGLTFMDRRTIVFPDLPKLIDAAHAAVRQHQRARL